MRVTPHYAFSMAILYLRNNGMLEAKIATREEGTGC
jgi:hypothetical protein